MIAGFDSAFDVLISSNEGGYADDPADPGGETCWGITARVARKHGYSGAMKDLPRDTARAIAKAEYWDPHMCDQMPGNMAFHVFDAAYNGGHPSIWLQQALGVTADGAIGAATLAALRAADPERVMRIFGAYRQIYLAGLPDPEWRAESRGWMRRLAHNQLIT